MTKRCNWEVDEALCVSGAMLLGDPQRIGAALQRKLDLRLLWSIQNRTLLFKQRIREGGRP